MNQSTLDKLVKRSYELLPRIHHSGNRHFSYIMDGKHILSFGINNIKKTHTMAIKYRWPFLHSEASAIARFPFPPSELRWLKMVNIRIGKDNVVKMAKPCNGCQNFLTAFELKEILFTNESGMFEKL